MPEGGTPESKAKLEAAIREHFSDMMLTSYVVLVSGVDPNQVADRTQYNQEEPDGQPFHATVGLMQTGIWAAQQYWGSEDTDA